MYCTLTHWIRGWCVFGSSPRHFFSYLDSQVERATIRWNIHRVQLMNHWWIENSITSKGFLVSFDFPSGAHIHHTTRGFSLQASISLLILWIAGVAPFPFLLPCTLICYASPPDRDTRHTWIQPARSRTRRGKTFTWACLVWRWRGE